MQKLMKLNDAFIFYLPYDDFFVILGLSLKAPKLGSKFNSDGDIYIVSSVDVSTKAVICKHA